MVDEWDVSDAENVTEVITWAYSLSDGNPFEIFVRWTDQHTSRDGVCHERQRATRIFGTPADEARTETVTLTGD